MKKMTAVLIAVLMMAATLSAEERGPSTPEERATAVKAARLLEEDPLGTRAKQARQWLTMWLIVVPDITVSICGDLLSDVPRSAKKYATEVAMQAAYSSTAFMIENPEQAKDAVAVHEAGLLGVLKAYAAIRKQQPKYSWPLLEELTRKRDSGELRPYVIAAAERCKAKS